MKTPVTRPDSIEAIRHALTADPFIVAEWYGQPEDDDICEPLIRALEDPHELVRAAAAGALISLDDMYAASPIVGVLAHGSVPARTAAAEVLGEIGRGDQIAIHHLTKALSDPDSGVRFAVGRSLAKLSR